MENTKNLVYEMTKSNVTNEDGVEYTAYGIKATCNNSVIDEISDVSTKSDFVSKLTQKMNNLDVHIEHFRDVIYDSVYAEYCMI